MAKKVALILSGGGAKGAFQVGAEKYARDIIGYHWDILAGVSVGALNAVMLAMGKNQRLLEIWNTVSNDQVYTGGLNLWSAIRLLFGAKSFYGNGPLQRLLHQEIKVKKIRGELRDFLRINALVKEAAAQGGTLHNPVNGRPLKYYDDKLIQPDFPLGDTLDFTQPSIQRSLKAGMEKARLVLGC